MQCYRPGDECRRLGRWLGYLAFAAALAAMWGSIWLLIGMLLVSRRNPSRPQQARATRLIVNRLLKASGQRNPVRSETERAGSRV
jgi:hypothetical protein